ncbi:hypothetical protein [Yersinia pekkanenii]|uniref:Uncharacterized protein n=1 Tax=Yersinia pekkanenii TaxID=1288385 RepID=A0A0T9QZR7_9GAMM|nr:hypothetical protein [Yersinia pekkanenii]CNI37201.1 Uncharacterised protein [Yersinia pekkanenii]CRY66667.1 Uncharacterised protein [Yersinia pekkanenii]
MFELVLVLILIAFFFLALAICTLMTCRNDWVFKVRTEVLNKRGYEVYSTLPSYETMFRTFWVWDVNKFLPKSDRKGATNG